MEEESLYKAKAKKTLRVILIISFVSLFAFGLFVTFFLRTFLIDTLNKGIEKELNIVTEHIKNELNDTLNHYNVYSFLILRDIFIKKTKQEYLENNQKFVFLKKKSDLNGIKIKNSSGAALIFGKDFSIPSQNFMNNVYLSSSGIFVKRRMEIKEERNSIEVFFYFTHYKLKNFIKNHIDHLPKGSKIFLLNGENIDILTGKKYLLKDFGPREGIFSFENNLISIKKLKDFNIKLLIITRKYLFFEPVIERIRKNIRLLLLFLAGILLLLYSLLVPNFNIIMREVDELLEEIKKDMEQLKEERERLNKYLDSSLNYFLIIKKDGTIEYSNKEANALFKTDENRCCEKFFDSFEEASKIVLKNKIKEILDENKPINRGIETKLKTGWIIYWMLTRFHDKNEPRIIASGINISPLKEAEEKLSTIYKAIEELEEGIVIVNKEQIVEYVNTTFLKMFSFSRNEIIGKTFFSLEEEFKCSYTFEDIFKRIISGETWRGELYREVDGKEYFYLATVSPVRDEKKRIIKFIGILRDITERKRMERELNHVSKMEAIGRLAGGIAHEFNNLLTMVIGYASMLRKKLNKNLKEFEGMEKALNKMTDLTMKILLFGRKEKGKIVNVNPNSRLKDIIDVFGKMIPENIDVEINISDEESAIEIDPQEFEQVVISVILNSIEAMKNGGNLKIRSFIEDLDNKKNWCLKITDSGTGIKKENIERVFEPFYTTKTSPFGRGLGLSIAYRIVEKYGGTIEIDSLLGKGTTVTIKFPAIRNDEEKKKETNIERNKRLDFSRYSVLIAEDEEDILEIAGEYFKSFGFKKIYKASDGKEAVEIAKKIRNLDLFFSDIVMPEISGDKAFLEIKKIHPKIKVLFTTGYTVKGDIEFNYPLIRKPYFRDDLLEKIVEVLKPKV